MCYQVDGFPTGLINLDLCACVAFPKKAKGKASLDFRDPFLAVGGYMQILFDKPPAKYRFFLYLWHARHKFNLIKTHLLDIAELIPHIDLEAPKPHIASRSLQHI